MVGLIHSHTLLQPSFTVANSLNANDRKIKNFNLNNLIAMKSKRKGMCVDVEDRCDWDCLLIALPGLVHLFVTFSWHFSCNSVEKKSLTSPVSQRQWYSQSLQLPLLFTTQIARKFKLQNNFSTCFNRLSRDFEKH